MSSHVITWPAPAGEMASPDFTVEVDGTPVFVYQARVRAEVIQKPGLWTHIHDGPAERASFAMFDTDGPVTVTVRAQRPISAPVVLPMRAGISPEVDGDCLRFTLDHPRHLTVLPDGTDAAPLHLFIGEPETDAPQPDDPDVIYFGPGVHEITTLDIQSGQTLYLAGGALVQAVLPPDDQGVYNEKWQVTFHAGKVLHVHDATGVRICGRGILDASRIPHPGRTMIFLDGSADVHISGITLRDAAGWNFRMGTSRNVTVEDVRILGARLNSDGINSVNSQHVRVRRCFVRNLDDAIVVKATTPELPAEDIVVEDCAVWSDWGYALGVSYETRAPIRQLTFRRCDLHFVRAWSLGVRVCDSATVSDVTFTDIEIADPARPALPDGSPYAALTREPQLLSLLITADVWSHDPERGRIRNVLVDGVTLYASSFYPSVITGIDAEHDIRHVTLRNIRLHGQPPATDAEALRLRCNASVEDMRLE